MKVIRLNILNALILWCYICSPQFTIAQTNTGRTVEALLNGLKITIDKESGSIIGLDYPGPGKIMEDKTGMGGIVDVAYPIPEFEPLRLASRFSKGAGIEKSEDAVVISWDNLGASRSYFKSKGNISAKVWLKAMPDGRSVSMKCQIDNQSELPVGQVLFPDFHGLLPLAGKEDTYLRTGGFTRRPFIDIGATTYPEFYAVDYRTKDNFASTGGGNFGNGDNMVVRWLDYGGLNGGFSLFPQVWTGAAITKIRIYRLEKDPNVRMMHVHDISIKKGEKWESPEYILTPHRYGWAKGIEPYRAFVKNHIKRLFPVPRHVREGLGFRTIFMCKGYPVDGAKDVAFGSADLPKVAKEAKANGLDELVLWFWQEPFQLPVPPPYPHLGTPEQFSDAIKECNKIGVNVSVFISVLSIGEPTASRYGWKTGPGWTYHWDLIPRYNPMYANSRGTKVADPADPQWSKDVLTSVKDIYSKYTQSITWDQAHLGTEELFRQFLPWAKKNNPEATFSGEITGSAERVADFFDYTWNWESGSYFHNLNAPYRDVRAFISSFPSPRLNFNINRNAQHIKYAFMDNYYVNVMPSAPDDANGTALINDYPDVGHALKQCASLRNQFLNYFTNGTLIGECLLRELPDAAHVNAYVLPDRVLLMIMNTRQQTRQVGFKVDLAPWLKSGTAKYRVSSYDQDGKELRKQVINGFFWTSQTSMMKNNGIEIFEFKPI
jgi:hypothetical protein